MLSAHVHCELVVVFVGLVCCGVLGGAHAHKQRYAVSMGPPTARASSIGNPEATMR